MGGRETTTKEEETLSARMQWEGDKKAKPKTQKPKKTKKKLT
jgi:hypothetical protein